MSGLEPFCWLAPLDVDATKFVVVEPIRVFDGYRPETYYPAADGAETLAIVTIASDWTRTTINLRAPIFIDKETRRGTQRILSESPYHFAEVLPQQ